MSTIDDEPGSRVQQEATASDHARIYQAGRDLHIHEVATHRRTTTDGPVGQPIDRITDPFALEVHRAIDITAPVTRAELPLLPVYVERAHDAVLRAHVVRVAGGDSALAVLVGGSSTGKTRACWEAVRRLPAGWRLWHPISPGHPEAVLAGIDAVEPHTVVWLNETQHYLLTPDPTVGEQVAAALRSLLRDPDRGPVLVLGTMWQQYWATSTSLPSPGTADPHAQARALLVGNGITVPDAFTDEALRTARGAADARLTEAVERATDGRIAQYLAGAPALLERYHHATAAARALIEAAMDARRLGHGPALPHALLATAAPGYLSDQQWDEIDDDWFEQALAYTRAPARGARGPLTPIRPRPTEPVPEQPLYRLADYLEQHGSDTRRYEAPPPAFWQAASEYAHTPDDQYLLGVAAARRGRARDAARLYLAAYGAGRRDARLTANRLRSGALNSIAEELAQDAADMDLFDRATRLSQGEDEGTGGWWWHENDELAERRLRLVCDEGGVSELKALAKLREKRGDHAGAERLRAESRRRANRGGYTWRELFRLRAGGDFTERMLQQAADSGDVKAVTNPVLLMMQAAEREGLDQLAHRMIRAGDMYALRHLVAGQREAANHDGAERLLRKAVDAGDTKALRDLAAQCGRAGDHESSERLLRAAVNAGDTYALKELAEQWEHAGDPDAAERLRRFGLDASGAIAQPWDVAGLERTAAEG
ncbi:hypothetical protein [Streptomyces calvus]|uniref:Sel1 repeat family protein n=1 Tax=Streptomyces calvus TaxID=67282 RepID=A0A514JT58_9ACTN|nr:hypothetical protein [Streptomyces calvus]QDI70523.1 hypothetical protein CD934_18875 [Streptomyces calvus]